VTEAPPPKAAVHLKKANALRRSSGEFWHAKSLDHDQLELNQLKLMNVIDFK
jgi:hypothetical protein